MIRSEDMRKPIIFRFSSIIQSALQATNAHQEIKYTGSILQRRRERFVSPLEGERPKSEEQYLWYTKLSDIIHRETNNLGIEVAIPTVDQIHLLERQIYNKYFPEAPACAHYSVYDDQISIRTTDHTQGVLLNHLMEELLHGASSKEVGVDIARKQLIGSRSGYGIHLNEGNYFDGLNEAIINDFKLEILHKHQVPLSADLCLNSEDTEGMLRGDGASYEMYLTMINKMLGRIAEHQGTSPDQLKKTFRLGLFNDEQRKQALNTIVDSYGEDAMEVLALFGFGSQFLNVALAFFGAKNKDEQKAKVHQLHETLDPEIVKGIPYPYKPFKYSI